MDVEGLLLLGEERCERTDGREVLLIDAKEEACFQNGLLRDLCLLSSRDGGRESGFVFAFEEGLDELFLLAEGGCRLRGSFLGMRMVWAHKEEPERKEPKSKETGGDEAAQLLLGI